ncbi:MAG: twitching motility protein PilT [Gemmatales bacterium]|nr:MAG: twitching motility protein PilT [Gemmatales bacterium]
MARTLTIENYLQLCVDQEASDLHLSGGAVPYLRLHGRLQPLDEPALPAEEVHRLAVSLMQPKQRELFEKEQTLDLAYTLDENNRFRINVFRERGRTALAIRRLEQKFRTLEEWNLPPQLAELAELRDGLVLVTGPTGSGKTTTLATLLHQINLTRACHIITVEDPVEYIHRNERSLVQQRELYTDVPSFADAVRAAMREDPNVILVGEMRDVETMRAAITAAETGHLVYSTLHTGDAVGAIDRMLGVFPAEEQDSVRNQLSMVLRAVLAQRLLPNTDGDGRVPVVEILRVTTAVAHLIRTGKPQQIYSAIEVGTNLGMQTLEQALADLVRRRLVHLEDARRLARDPRLFEERLRLQPAPPSSGGNIRDGLAGRTR